MKKEKMVEVVKFDDNPTAMKQLAVEVDDAVKSYGSVEVLKGLCMKITRGTIYGLLGPSGCGKTSFLNILVGHLSLDAGLIRTLVKSRREIGYMPQELALPMEFKIDETFKYFGKIYGLSKRDVINKTAELMQLLMLPDKERIVSTLSGGQQRRLSLAVTLIHDPDLVILDEPTVGVDPILSANIWEKLLFMSKTQGKTIVITTHYIEEAKQADTIGLMRDGVILAEGNPLEIMADHGTDSLETAFLNLSHQQEKMKKIEPSSTIVLKARPHLEESSSIEWHRVYAQASKLIIWMKRNFGVLLFILLLPAFQLLTQFQTIGGDPKGITLAVINDEFQGNNLNCSQSYSNTQCSGILYSCRYLEYLKKKGLQIEFMDDITEAQQKMQFSRTIWAVMYFNRNFSSSLLARSEHGRFTPDNIVDQAEVSVWNEKSNYMVKEILRKKLVDSYIQFLREIYAECGWSPKLANIPVNFQEAIHGSMELNFSYSSLPPAVLQFAFFLPLLFTLSNMQAEITSGSWNRISIAGVTIMEAIMGNVLGQICVTILQLIMVLFIDFYLYESPQDGSYFLVVSIYLINSFTGMFLGLILSFTTSSMTEAFMASLGIYISTTIVGGSIWPVEGMQTILKVMYYALPVASAGEAMRSITARGMSMIHLYVWSGFLSSIVYLLLFLISLFVIVKLKRMGYNLSLKLF